MLAFEKLVTPITRPETPSTLPDADHRLDVAVVFTSAHATSTALIRAGALAQSLGARITLIVAQVVPFPLPIETPPVLLDFSEQRFRQIAASSPVETTVKIYLCRDPVETLKSVLARQSPIVIGGRRRWWPTREHRLARQLRRAGFEVIVTGRE
jgi:hypothetical protein